MRVVLHMAEHHFWVLLPSCAMVHQRSPGCNLLLQLPSWSMPKITESWNITCWKGPIRIETEAFRTKSIRFHGHHLMICNNSSSSEHQTQQESLLAQGMQPSRRHFKKSALNVCGGQSTFLRGLCHLLAAEDNPHCHSTRRAFLRAFCTPSPLPVMLSEMDTYRHPHNWSNSSTIPTHRCISAEIVMKFYGYGRVHSLHWVINPLLRSSHEDMRVMLFETNWFPAFSGAFLAHMITFGIIRSTKTVGICMQQWRRYTTLYCYRTLY